MVLHPFKKYFLPTTGREAKTDCCANHSSYLVVSFGSYFWSFSIMDSTATIVTIVNLDIEFWFGDTRARVPASRWTK